VLVLQAEQVILILLLWSVVVVVLVQLCHLLPVAVLLLLVLAALAVLVVLSLVAQAAAAAALVDIPVLAGQGETLAVQAHLAQGLVVAVVAKPDLLLHLVVVAVLDYLGVQQMVQVVHLVLSQV